ncbi:MAG: trypsin-like peptidase domain-containing protein, partial [bacterium]
MRTKNKTMAFNNACAKEKLKSWLVGLVVLIVIVIGWFLLGKGWKHNERAREDRRFLGKTNLAAGIKSGNKPNQATIRRPQDSYHNVVELVKPAVVGISLSNAQPFFQRWGAMETQTPDLAWRKCPHCGWVIIDHPENPSVPILCPNCAAVIAQDPQVQQQVWLQPSQSPQVQMQAWGIRGQGFGSNVLTMFCPNCGMKVTRQPGIPWASITCPNCGSAMFCPRLPNNPLPGQQQVWMQPTAQQAPPVVIQNAPLPLIDQGAVMPGFQGLGSGVIVSKRGYVLTNSHLVSGQRFVTVTLFTTQGQRSFKGQIVAQAPDRDLAIVKIDPQNIDLPVVPTGNSDAVQVGDTV